MKKYITLLFVTVCACIIMLPAVAMAQGDTITMTNGTITTDGGFFYDDGGPAGDYSNNQNFVLTICPETSGEWIQASFTSFSIEAGFDALWIFSGAGTPTYPCPNDTTPPVPAPGQTFIGTYWGTNSPGIVHSTTPDGCLTFVFCTDGSVTSTGWSAQITSNVCADGDADDDGYDYVTYGNCGGTDCDDSNAGINPGVFDIFCDLIDQDCSGADNCPSFGTVNDFGGNFHDDGGPAGDYSSNQNFVRTIGPDAPDQRVQANFTSFSIEAGFDAFWIFSGAGTPTYPCPNDTTPPVPAPGQTFIGTYWGTNSPGIVHSTTPDGCLTFVFCTDGSVISTGWSAELSNIPLCVDADNDGHFAINPNCPGSNDCDDGDPDNYPGNAEVCDNADNDCDTIVDNGLGIDNDSDNHGDPASCTTDTTLLIPYDDCDDDDINNFPGNTEICDCADNDCDGQEDEGCPVTIAAYIDTIGLYNFGCPINATIDCTALATPGTITVTVHPDEYHSQTANDTVNVWYEITSTGSMTVDLTLNYSGYDLNGEFEGDLCLWRYNRATWEQYVASNIAGGKVTVNGVSQFSDWTIADSAGGIQPPVPEIVTIIMISIGLMILGGFIWYRRRNQAMVAA